MARYKCKFCLYLATIFFNSMGFFLTKGIHGVWVKFTSSFIEVFTPMFSSTIFYVLSSFLWLYLLLNNKYREIKRLLITPSWRLKKVLYYILVLFHCDGNYLWKYIVCKKCKAFF